MKLLFKATGLVTTFIIAIIGAVVFITATFLTCINEKRDQLSDEEMLDL